MDERCLVALFLGFDESEGLSVGFAIALPSAVPGCQAAGDLQRLPRATARFRGGGGEGRRAFAGGRSATMIRVVPGTNRVGCTLPLGRPGPLGGAQGFVAVKAHVDRTTCEHTGRWPGAVAGRRPGGWCPGSRPWVVEFGKKRIAGWRKQDRSTRRTPAYAFFLEFAIYTQPVRRAARTRRGQAPARLSGLAGRHGSEQFK